MKNTLSIYLAALVFLLTNTLSAQTENPWFIGLQVGVANYVTASDFEEVVYTVEGRPNNYSLGNIVEPNLSPVFNLEVGVDLSHRWRLTGFGQFQRHSGTLYENEITIFGVSSFLDEPVEFSSPADNELTVFQLGLQAQYRVLQGRNIRGYLGAGLSFLSRSHNYRDRLEVDFSESRMPNSISEFYTTEDKTAFALPFSARLEKDLSPNIFLSLTGQLTTFPNLEDYQTMGAIGIHYRL